MENNTVERESNIPESNFSCMYEMTMQLARELNKKFEEIFIEGLYKKGYQFNNDSDRIEFIKIHCRCEDNPLKKERVYYVCDLPFLLHSYGIETKTNFDLSSGFKIEAVNGGYMYL